ncbi:MAG: glycogen synthase [Actinomycetota bacterium]|nr:glycogen synthase [Actinomycetota bacterium]
MSNQLKILMVAAEAVPFAKIGGLADVVGSLPKALKKLEHDVRVCIPCYATIDQKIFQIKKVAETEVPMGNEHKESAIIRESVVGENVPVYLIDNVRYFSRERIYGYPDDEERFVFFCRAVLEMLKIFNWQPDIIHCNDWHTGIIPNYLKTLCQNEPFFTSTATVYAIHNLAYQGKYEDYISQKAGLGAYDSLSPPIAGLSTFMGRGIYFADVVNTVSERYALEIQTPEYGEKLDSLLRSRRERLFGILNGIDYEEYNPATDKRIVANYDSTTIENKAKNKAALQKECNLPVNPGLPVIGMVSRLTGQKGLDLVANAIHGIMLLDLQLILLGTGDDHFKHLFSGIAQKHPMKMCTNIAFDPNFAQRIYAGSDMLLMPSLFEPCGLSQLIAMRYGTVPIVRSIGGLADTVTDYDPSTSKGNGFVFETYDHWVLFATVVRAVEIFKNKNIWRELIVRGMGADYSWISSAKKYVQLYKKALELKKMKGK